jgi:hypothetical protein
MLTLTQLVHNSNAPMLLLVALESPVYGLSVFYIDNDHIRTLNMGRKDMSFAIFFQEKMLPPLPKNQAIGISDRIPERRSSFVALHQTSCWLYTSDFL